MTTANSSTSNNEEEINKAIKFWKHPSLASVSSQEKIEYLKSKGLSADDIHLLWDKLVEQPEETSVVPTSPPPIEQQHNQFEEEAPHAKLALMTVGGAVGLSAAAAVRWLNGGDFALFPPATATTATKRELGETDTHETEQVPEDDDDTPELLAQQIQALTEMVKVQSEAQERILKHITTQQTKQATDQSMALLRPTSASPPSQELLEIKALLATSTDEVAKEALEKLTAYLSQEERLASAPTARSVTYSEDSVDLRNASVDYHSSSTSLREVMERLVLENDIADLQSGCQVLYLYVVHLSSHPHVPRYRKIFVANASFQKVEKLTGGVDVLLSVGFVENDAGYLEWQPENEQEAVKTLQEAAAALSILKSNNSNEQTQEDLCRSALSSLRPTNGPETPGTDGHLLVSPPNTKKQAACPSPGNFVAPALDEQQDGVRQLFEGSSPFQPVLQETSAANSEDELDDDNSKHD